MAALHKPLFGLLVAIAITLVLAATATREHPDAATKIECERRTEQLRLLDRELGHLPPHQNLPDLMTVNSDEHRAYIRWYTETHPVPHTQIAE